MLIALGVRLARALEVVVRVAVLGMVFSLEMSVGVSTQEHAAYPRISAAGECPTNEAVRLVKAS